MNELLTIKEMAEKLKVSRQTIYEWRKKGMPYKTIGAVIRFDINEVVIWIEKQNEGQ
jgi:excisionase family DNA binding protein